MQYLSVLVIFCLVLFLASGQYESTGTGTSDGTENRKWVKSTTEQNRNKVTLVLAGPHSQSAYVAEFCVCTLS